MTHYERAIELAKKLSRDLYVMDHGKYPREDGNFYALNAKIMEQAFADLEAEILARLPSEAEIKKQTDVFVGHLLGGFGTDKKAIPLVTIISGHNHGARWVCEKVRGK